MKSNVTLKETVGVQMVYALLLACYYWMWARRDWYDFYTTLQHMVVIFTIVFFALQAFRICKYGKAEKTEQEIRHLHKADAMAFKCMVGANILIAFAAAIAQMDGRTAGYALVGTIFAAAVIRFLLFSGMCKQ